MSILPIPFYYCTARPRDVAMPAGRPSKKERAQRVADQAARELASRIEMSAIGKKSGLPDGVNKTDTGRYQARIKLEGKRINLGSFDTPEEAAAAYFAASSTGFTGCASPKKNSNPRGTGPRLARSPQPAIPPILTHVAIDSLTGRRKGAQEEVAAARAAQPAPAAARIPSNATNFFSAHMPVAVAVPVRWEERVALAP